MVPWLDTIAFKWSFCSCLKDIVQKMKITAKQTKKMQKKPLEIKYIHPCQLYLRSFEGSLVVGIKMEEFVIGPEF